MNFHQRKLTKICQSLNILPIKGLHRGKNSMKCRLMGGLFLIFTLVTTQNVFADRYLQMNPDQIRSLISPPDIHHQNRTKHRAILKAKQMLRVPYRWGGTTPRGFDCSGLTQYSFKHAGIEIPRTAQQQYNALPKVRRQHMTEGDLIFFHMPRRGHVNHVGIYLGNNTFIHAPGRGQRVKVSKLSAYWNKKVVGVRRPR